MLAYTVFAQEEIFLFNFLLDNWSQMLVVEPILTLVALDHVLIHVFTRVRLLAIAIAVKVVMIIHIGFILIVFLVVEELACLGHAPIATVASKFQLGIKLNNIMALMTVDHAADAEAVWLHELDQFTIVRKACLYDFALVIRKGI